MIILHSGQRRLICGVVLASDGHCICTPEKYEQMSAAYGARAVILEMLAADIQSLCNVIGAFEISAWLQYQFRHASLITSAGAEAARARSSARLQHIQLSRALCFCRHFIDRRIRFSLPAFSCQHIVCRLPGPMNSLKNAECQRLSPFSAGSIVCHIEVPPLSEQASRIGKSYAEDHSFFISPLNALQGCGLSRLQLQQRAH